MKSNNVMMEIFAFLIVLLLSTGAAFTPNMPVTKTMTTSRLSLTTDALNDEVIDRLKREYRELQDKLFQDLEEHKMEAAAEDEREIFEKAVDLASVQRQKEEEKLSEAEHHWIQALGDLDEAEKLKAQARSDAAMAEEEAAMIESIDAGYEDEERRRDLSVAHAAHKLEDDANDLLIEAQLNQLKAKVEYEDAYELLRDLKENEKLLHETLSDLKKEKDEAARKKWTETELPKHKAFLSSARKTVKSGKLIDHDPTKCAEP